MNLGPDGVAIGVLDDLVVVDLSPMMPGHVCSMILGDLGARVITVERPGQGHFSRSTVRGSFESVNRNKESLTLDLKRPDAQRVLSKLVARADVVIEGFRPGVAARLGADYDTLRATQPKIIYCSMSGYGQDGAWRDRSGHDPNYLGVAGVLSLAGDPDGPPTADVGAPIADLAGAWFAVIGLLAAIRARDRIGIGQYIDLSLADSAFALVQTRIVEFLVNDRPNKAQIMSRPGLGAFEASDGCWLTVGAAEDHFWQSLCDIIGRADWLADERFATNQSRRPFGSEIRSGLRAAFRGRPRGEWLAAFGAAGVPCAPINDLGEAAESDHARSRQLVEWIDHPLLGRLPQLRFPPVLSATPASIRRRPPLLGEHNDDILRELGYSTAEIDALRSDGII